MNNVSEQGERSQDTGKRSGWNVVTTPHDLFEKFFRGCAINDKDIRQEAQEFLRGMDADTQRIIADPDDYDCMNDKADAIVHKNEDPDLRLAIFNACRKIRERFFEFLKCEGVIIFELDPPKDDEILKCKGLPDRRRRMGTVKGRDLIYKNNKLPGKDFRSSPAVLTAIDDERLVGETVIRTPKYIMTLSRRHEDFSTLDKKIPDLDLETRLQLIADILEGIKALHDNEVTHNDIKPENIMVLSKNGHLRAKIFDMEYFTTDPGQISGESHIFGELWYYTHEGRQTASDIFSAAMLIYFMLKNPKEHTQDMFWDDIQKNCYNTKYDKKVKAHIYTLPSAITELKLHQFFQDRLPQDMQIFVPLLCDMTKYDRASRLNIDQVIERFNGIRKKLNGKWSSKWDLFWKKMDDWAVEHGFS